MLLPPTVEAESRPHALQPAAEPMGHPPDGNAQAVTPDRPACPYCGGVRVHKHGSVRHKDGSRTQRYRCLSCGHTYLESTGKPTHRLRKRAEWDQMVLLLAHDISLRKMAGLLGIQLETAFRWRHRAMAALGSAVRDRLSGEVCVSHILVRYSEKGSRVCNGPGSWGYWNWLRRRPQPPKGSPRPDVRQAWPQPQRPRFRLVVDGRPICIMVAQTEAGHESAILGQDRITAATLARGLGQLVGAGAEVYVFGDRTYQAACHQAGITYNDGYRTRWEQPTPVEGSDVALRSVRCPDDPLWWLKRFRGVATRYLPHYLAWYRDIVRVVSSTGGWPLTSKDGRLLLLGGAA